MPIIDSHAHIDHIEDIGSALAAAHDSDVSDIIAVSVDLAAMKTNLRLQKEFARPRIHVALGIHPGNIKPNEVDESLEFIRDHIQEAVAIGECGLDFWYPWARKDREKKDEQKDIFQRQIDLALEFDKPLIIHTRGTWQHALEMTVGSGVTRALFHWYSGPVDILRKILDAGFYVSTSPSVAYSPQSRDAMAYAPVDRTLIETDTPVKYAFNPVSEERRESSPKDVWQTLNAYATLKGLSPDDALTRVNANARHFFALNP
jgi:TatD DNase family protein